MPLETMPDLKPVIDLLLSTGQRLNDQQRDLDDPKLIELAGRPYTTKSVVPFKEPTPEPICVSTLTSLADYVKGNPDNINLSTHLLRIASPTRVVLESALSGPFLQRHQLIVAEAKTLPHVAFGTFLPVADFNIMLLSAFCADENRNQVLSITGNITSGAQVTQADDGISQEVTVKAGIARKAMADMPAGIELRPYRTFTDVSQQPASNFVLRMKETPNGVHVGLFEADGGAWRGKAIAGIKSFLDHELTVDGKRLVEIIG